MHASQAHVVRLLQISYAAVVIRLQFPIPGLSVPRKPRKATRIASPVSRRPQVENFITLTPNLVNFTILQYFSHILVLSDSLVT